MPIFLLSIWGTAAATAAQSSSLDGEVHTHIDPYSEWTMVSYISMLYLLSFIIVKIHASHCQHSTSHQPRIRTRMTEWMSSHRRYPLVCPCSASNGCDRQIMYGDLIKMLRECPEDLQV